MIQKQNLNINFAQGLDTKTDPFQIAPNNFLSLENQVFTVGNRLTKRNGYKKLTGLPNASSSDLTTLNGNLTALGNSIYAYNEGSQDWVTKGTIQPLEVDTLPLIRNNFNQIQVDAAVAPNGLVCTVYMERQATNTYIKRYAIADSVTGQNIIAPTNIPNATSGLTAGSPRVFVLGNFFVIAFTHSSGPAHLQYIAISLTNPTSVTSPQDIASSYVPNSSLSWDGVVAGNNLYFAYNTTSGGQSVKLTYLTAAAAAAGGSPVAPVTFAAEEGDIMSLGADLSGVSPVIWAGYWSSATNNVSVLAVNSVLGTILAPTVVFNNGATQHLTVSGLNGICHLYADIADTYLNGNETDFILGYQIDEVGNVSVSTTIIRSVGLASKSFIVNGVIFFLAAYGSTYQPTYFLINASLSTQASPVVVAKLAYTNGGGFLPYSLPGVSLINGNTAYIGYLFKDLIEAVNKGTNLPSGTPPGGVYSQTGINLATLTIGTTDIDTAEIGQNLLLSGGFLWSYDGYLPVEQNFLLFPDFIQATSDPTTGSMTAQQYFYQLTYEWSDNQGNIYRSAPSVPVTVTLTSDTSVQIAFPYLRLTYKTANPVKIVIYRWSVAQPVYYQVTSLITPILNDTTNDSNTFIDTKSDAQILGNNILYTNGGVVEDVNAPASKIFTLFDTRFWLVDAEDQNLLWYSKQVIEATPVEMSDLFTFYVAPTQAAQGSTGPITALAPMDDKLIIFKANAIYYINGTGPDNTGANNQYSQPIFITSTVGCENQQSIVFQPNGLMFQSEKGIWLLGRDLSTSYIGAPVEEFNSSLVQSALNIPETNQVRFTLNSGQTLMFDYYYGQWATFTGVPAISSCVFQGLHTFLNASGQVYQENPGSYLDGSNPVLMSLTSAWFNLAGLQGYQRAYFFYLLGQYLSPHKLQIGIAYDYNSAPSQTSLITPTNFGSTYGGPTPNPGNGTDPQDPLGQQTPLGGEGNIEQWRVFLARQRCQAFQISLQEIYDPTFNVPPGAGLTLSGINLVYGAKQRFRPQPARNSIGGGGTAS